MQPEKSLDAYHFYEREWTDYGDLKEEFDWHIPGEFNIAEYVSERWATESREAIYYEAAGGETETVTFEELDEAANSLANVFRSAGIERGDRIAVNLPQRPETVIAHVAIWKLGAISLPLSTLYGPEGLSYRIKDAEAKAIVVDDENVNTVREIRDGCDSLTTVLVTGNTTAGSQEHSFWDEVTESSSEFDTVRTAAEDPALVLYTSGTTGDPKGVVHAHRILLGFLPTIVTTIGNSDIKESDVFWSPTEWAWIGTLLLVVIPPLFYGRPILAYHGGSFDPTVGFDLIDRYTVTNLFAPPTALRMMMQVDDPDERYDIGNVRAITSGGEALGTNIVDWVDETFEGAALNDWYGQTEADPIATGCAALIEFKEGRIGYPSLGVEIEILDPETGDPTVETGEVGEIAVDLEASRPVCFLEYWNKPEKTNEKIQDGWLLTEDLGFIDEDGYVGFHSRKDDVIISSGYRIGPEEIEDSLASHEAVREAGVVGISDDLRGEVPKAFVVVGPGHEPSATLEQELKEFVKERLAKYEYPHEIEFRETLPTTVTGKIKRTALRERDDPVG